MSTPENPIGVNSHINETTMGWRRLTLDDVREQTRERGGQLVGSRKTHDSTAWCPGERRAHRSREGEGGWTELEHGQCTEG